MAGGTERRRVALARALSVSLLVLASCGGDGSTVVVRGADDVQVMSPAEVAEQRLPLLTIPDTTAAAPTGTDDTNAGGTAPDTVPGDTVPGGAAETVPQNQDTRPPEIRLFEAFGKFRSCLEDKGYGIEGNLLDPKNPAYQDPNYLDAVQTCAARTDIVAVLQEVQATRASLTPAEVEERNKVFVDLRECLVAKGWTVETRTSEIGLLEPTTFQNADGVLDERDINQCLSEMNLGG